VTISLLSKAAGHPNLDQVFAPYYEGTKPPATGLLDDSGSDIVNRYAPIVYGSQAAATGLLTEQSGNADINTLFAAYGTANYPLSINGGNYTTTLTRDGTGGPSAHVTFTISGSGWVLASSGTAGTVSPGSNFAIGTIPSGSATVEFTTASPTGQIRTYGTTGSKLSISSNPSLDAYVTAAGTIGTASGSIQITIVFYDASNRTISTTTYTATCIIQN
jgi:hypothetical protein